MFTLLRNADVYAPEALGHRHVLICDERIAWIGEDELSLPSSLACAVHDLEGRRLIPGLVDCHAHLTGGGGEAGFHTRVPAPALSHYTSGGVTSVVGLLGTDDETRDTAGLLATARGLNEEGLSAWCYTGGYHLPPTTLTGSVRKDIVHLDRVLGVGEIAISDHRSSQPTLDELLRLASEAHVAGLITGKAGTLHLHLGDGERGLELVRASLAESELPARVFHPTHLNRKKALFEEGLELARQGCHIDFTTFPVEEGDDAWEAGEALLRYLDTGLPPERVSLSSDGGGCLPAFDEHGRVAHMDIGRPAALIETLRRLLLQGHALERILPAVSSNPAQLLRLHDKGRIRVGGDADLVVLDSEHRIRDVIARGRWHRQEGRTLVLGTFEQDRS